LDTRLTYARYLSSSGLNTYIYCPKGDPFLRRRWQDHWPDSLWNELLQQSVVFRDCGVHWGIGLSPVELYKDYGPTQRSRLKRKLDRLAELAAPLIAILFDDMPGNIDSLADRQAEIIADVSQWSPHNQVLVCPTYYSFDPVLERYFGSMPCDYWQQLGKNLSRDIQIFWTGNKVCSESIAASDLESIVEQLGRPVILWDNYPVNDGAVRSNFLYLSKLSNRSSELRPLISGHLCNPMNQGLISLPALSGLVELYGCKEAADSLLPELLGPRTLSMLSRDMLDFEYLGLEGLGELRRRQLAIEYSRLPGGAALEVAGWLRGEYKFDPACLTG